MQAISQDHAAALDTLDDHIDQAQALAHLLIHYSDSAPADGDTLRCALHCLQGVLGRASAALGVVQSATA